MKTPKVPSTVPVKSYQRQCDVSDWKKHQNDSSTDRSGRHLQGDLKKEFKFCAMEDENKWKVKVIKELVNVKQGSARLEGEDGGNMLTTSEID